MSSSCFMQNERNPNDNFEFLDLIWVSSSSYVNILYWFHRGSVEQVEHFGLLTFEEMIVLTQEPSHSEQTKWEKSQPSTWFGNSFFVSVLLINPLGQQRHIDTTMFFRFSTENCIWNSYTCGFHLQWMCEYFHILRRLSIPLFKREREIEFACVKATDATRHYNAGSALGALSPFPPHIIIIHYKIVHLAARVLNARAAFRVCARACVSDVCVCVCLGVCELLKVKH